MCVAAEIGCARVWDRTAMESNVQVEASRTDAETLAALRSRVRLEMTAGRDRYRAAFERLQSECREKARARLREMGWGDFEPRNAIEECSYKHIVYFAERLEHVIAARSAERENYIRKASESEELETIELARRLYFNPHGPWGIFGSPTFTRREPGGPDRCAEKGVDPAVVVESLASSAAGCKWMLDEWAEISREVESVHPVRVDNFRMTRLMGKRFLDALDDPEVTEVFLANHAINQRERNAFADLRVELCVDEIKERHQRMRRSGKWPSEPRDAAEGRARLLKIIERARTRVQERAEEHRKRAESGATEAALGQAFDKSPQAQSLNRAERDYSRAVSHGIAELRKLRRLIDKLNGEKREEHETR
jgi:hypothetical protein